MKNLKDLLLKLNIKTNNIKLYETALTHSSYANENNTQSNERLEYLGDAVLELFMSLYLYKKFPFEKEGELTKKRAKAVCEDALCAYSKHLDLKSYIKLGKGELMSKGATNAMVADAFEAMLAAIFLDKGFNYTKNILKKVVLSNLYEIKEITDFKTELQEVMMTNKQILKYKIIEQSGPAHNKKFKAAVYLSNDILVGTGIGRTKKEAEQNAAKSVLEKGEYRDIKKNI